MRFEWYPLDQQVCELRIGSFAYDKRKMNFKRRKFEYFEEPSNTVLDYSVEIVPLDEKDSFVTRDIYRNYSVTGFEMKLNRNFPKYFLNYYFPSGLFVTISWVICLLKNSTFSDEHILLYFVKLHFYAFCNLLKCLNICWQF